MDDFLLEITVGADESIFGYRLGSFGSVVDGDVGGTIFYELSTNNI